MMNDLSAKRNSRELASGKDLLPAFALAPVPHEQPVAQPSAFNLCCLLKVDDTLPQFVMALRRPIRLKDVVHFPKDHQQAPQIACVAVTGCDVNFGLDPRFEQTWTLTTVKLGDLSSIMSLAPGEKLTLEFQNTQRKVLDTSTIDSTESMDSSESTTMDKEAVNVSRSSSKTEGWHVDTSGTLTVGYASLNEKVGYSKSTTDSSQQTINHVTEATKKSAHSLKSLHKIEVRGVSEGLITNRMTRVIKNPYRDRTLLINIFQLEKHFQVQTALTEVRSALILTIDGLNFDKEFVLANVDFLQNELLDPTLIDALPTILAGTLPLFVQDTQALAGQIARRTLHLLFSDDVNMFNVPKIEESLHLSYDPNPPSTSFNASFYKDNQGKINAAKTLLANERNRRVVQ